KLLSIELRHRREEASSGIFGERLRVELLDHTEATKLALDPVEVPVVIAVCGDELGVAHVVAGFDAFDDVDWKRQPRHPWRPCRAILQVELRRSRVRHASFCTEIIGDSD